MDAGEIVTAKKTLNERRTGESPRRAGFRADRLKLSRSLRSARFVSGHTRYVVQQLAKGHSRHRSARAATI